MAVLRRPCSKKEKSRVKISDPRHTVVSVRGLAHEDESHSENIKKGEDALLVDVMSFINTFVPPLVTWQYKTRSSKADCCGSPANPPLGCSLGYMPFRLSSSVQNIQEH